MVSTRVRYHFTQRLIRQMRIQKAIPSFDDGLRIGKDPFDVSNPFVDSHR